MAAFALSSSAAVRATLHTPSIDSTALLPRSWQSHKRKRGSEIVFRMTDSEKETPKPEHEITPKDKEEDDDERLQRDPIYVYREFGKVSAAAVLIGLVLFFFDILVALWVTTIGLLYALAVLFEVKGADTLFSNVLNASMKLCRSFTEGIRKGWKALRRELRNGLKD